MKTKIFYTADSGVDLDSLTDTVTVQFIFPSKQPPTIESLLDATELALYQWRHEQQLQEEQA